MAGLTPESLERLPNGTELLWSFASGSQVARHRAVIKKRVNKSLLLHVYFDGVTPEGRRWSLITNQPLHEWRGHIGGKVWLDVPLQSGLA